MRGSANWIYAAMVQRAVNRDAITVKSLPLRKLGVPAIMRSGDELGGKSAEEGRDERHDKCVGAVSTAYTTHQKQWRSLRSVPRWTSTIQP